MNITEEGRNFETIEDSIYTYDNFFEDSWDYVSEHIVDDTYYENNTDFIRELTYDLYNQYENSNRLSTLEKQAASTKEVGKLLEIFFSNLIRHKG
jgi:hypothetical protein